MKNFILSCSLLFAFLLLGCASLEASEQPQPKAAIRTVCLLIDTKDVFVSKDVDKESLSSAVKRMQKYTLKYLDRARIVGHIGGECLPEDYMLSVRITTLEEAEQSKLKFTKMTTKYIYKIKYELEILRENVVVAKKEDDEDDDSLDELLESISDSIVDFAKKKIKNIS